jgi:hypothetical protein
LPSITPSYLYTFVALIAVSSLLIFSFMAYAEALRASSETRQLKNLMDYVAAESTELLTLALATNATSEAFLQMPASIGNKQYWLQFRNDSSKTLLEGGLGNVPMEGTELRIYLPKEASATGYYVGGYGAAHLKCYLDAEVPQIQLTSSSEGD